MDEFSGKSGQIRLFSDDGFDLVRQEIKEDIEACAAEISWAKDFDPESISLNGMMAFLSKARGNMHFVAMRSEGITDPYYVVLSDMERDYGKKNSYVLTQDQAIETIGFYQSMRGFAGEIDDLAARVVTNPQHTRFMDSDKALFEIQLEGGLKFVAGHIDRKDRKGLLDAFQSDQEMHQRLIRAINQAGDRQNGKGWQPELVT